MSSSDVFKYLKNFWDEEVFLDSLFAAFCDRKTGYVTITEWSLPIADS